MTETTLAWLLAGDPAIRWQALAELTDAKPSTVSRERRKVAKEGWGARLLRRQDPEGTWAGGLYTPKWTSTTYPRRPAPRPGVLAGPSSLSLAPYR